MKTLTGIRIFVVFALIMQITAKRCLNVPSWSKSVTGLKYTKRSCESAANLILSGMMQNADRCHNYYDYACGNWGKEHSLSSGEEMLDNFEIANTKTDEILKDILLRKIDWKDIDAVRKAKLSFATCMNEDKIEKYGMKGIKDILRSNGGWPLIQPNGTWTKGVYRWQRIHNNYMNYIDVSGFFKIYVNPDPTNIGLYIIWLNKPDDFRLSNVDLAFLSDDDSNMQSYRKYVWTIVKEIGNFSEDQQLTDSYVKATWDMIDFEAHLAKITLMLDPHDLGFELMTIDELQAYYDSVNSDDSISNINWLNTIKRAFVGIPNNGIDSQEKIRVVDKRYLLLISDLLNATPEETIVNYLHWKLVDKTVMYTTKKMKSNLNTFLSSSTENEFDDDYDYYDHDEPRNEWCLQEAGLTHALNYVYVKEHLPDSAIKWTENIIDEMKKVMTYYINRSPWLEEETRDLMQKRIDYLKVLIGSPDWYTDRGINNYYKNLNVGDCFFDNMLNRRKFELDNKRRLLKTIVDRKKWLISASDLDGYYNTYTNTIMIPTGIFQLPFYDAERLEVINYAWAGTLIGHLVAQAFKNFEYGNRTQCFINKFNRYKIHTQTNGDLWVHGKIALHENIAYAMGVYLADEAYRWWQRKYEDHTSFVNFQVKELSNFTSEQLFYLSWTKMWCSIETEEVLLSNSPNEILHPMRVIGVLSNSKSFGKVFNCDPGTTMNSKVKCVI